MLKKQVLPTRIKSHKVKVLFTLWKKFPSTTRQRKASGSHTKAMCMTLQILLHTILVAHRRLYWQLEELWNHFGLFMLCTIPSMFGTGWRNFALVPWPKMTVLITLLISRYHSSLEFSKQELLAYIVGIQCMWREGSCRPLHELQTYDA